MNLEHLCTQTIRYLAVDAVNQANSGHPGLPMGAAPMAKVLFRDHLRFNPQDPQWLGRDRFILSAGHGSALLYSLLHLYGYDVSLEDLKEFRQVDSKTPGHPEYGETQGVEVTTGPLGQGLAHAVGFAMASKKMAAEHGPLFDTYTYVLVGDGDMMEGITSEASSLAGHLALEKLIVLYDSNNITIDGRTDISFTENVRQRYEAYGWKTFLVEDGTDEEAISQAIAQAKKSNAPSFIEIKTIIGYGSPNKSDSSSVHGSPLGEEETRLTKEATGWPYKENFFVPEEVREAFQKQIQEKIRQYDDWMKEYDKQKIVFPEITEDALGALLAVGGGEKATRIHGQVMINELARLYPALFGGSADLAGSNMTTMEGKGFFSAESAAGSNIHFGIREHAMAAMVNGICLHGYYKGYGATFLSFADYMKPSLRLAALMGVPSVFIFTHDSIGVGEDGPTHQPIEQALMLRSIPGMKVYRPADGLETAMSYYQAFTSEQPVSILLTRQKLKELDMDRSEAHRGGYVALWEENEAELILMASGSELGLALEAAKKLRGKMDIRVVSMLSMEVFEAQSEDYKEKVLPAHLRKRYAIEAASPLSWYRYLGLDGRCTCLDHYGASGPGDELFKLYGFSVENIIEEILRYSNEGQDYRNSTT